MSATHKAALRPLDPPGRKRYSVRAVDNAKLVIFRRNMLDRLVSEADVAGQNVSDELEVSEIATARSSDWMIRMLQSELFSVLPATNIQRIFAHMEQVSCKADQVVVQQGAARRKSILLADMDSTMLEQECIDEMADMAGNKAHVAAITAR